MRERLAAGDSDQKYSTTWWRATATSCCCAQGELYLRVGFIVTNLSRPSERVVKF
jgi:hypothetical protein